MEFPEKFLEKFLKEALELFSEKFQGTSEGIYQGASWKTASENYSRTLGGNSSENFSRTPERISLEFLDKSQYFFQDFKEEFEKIPLNTLKIFLWRYWPR